MAWTSALVQARAAQAVFLILAFQIPVFRTPCRTGICESPLEVMVGQLSVSFPIPEDIVRVVLYPGAVTRSFTKAVKTRSQIQPPNWDRLLIDYNLDSVNARKPEFDYRLEVMSGSYFIVGGGIQAMFKAGRLGVLGMFLTAYGLWKHGAFSSADAETGFQAEIYPMFWALLLLTVLTLRFDKQKVERIASSVTGGSKPKGKRKLV